MDAGGSGERLSVGLRGLRGQGGGPLQEREHSHGPGFRVGEREHVLVERNPKKRVSDQGVRGK